MGNMLFAHIYNQILRRHRTYHPMDSIDILCQGLYVSGEHR